MLSCWNKFIYIKLCLGILGYVVVFCGMFWVFWVMFGYVEVCCGMLEYVGVYFGIFIMMAMFGYVDLCLDMFRYVLVCYGTLCIKLIQHLWVHFSKSTLFQRCF